MSISVGEQIGGFLSVLEPHHHSHGCVWCLGGGGRRTALPASTLCSKMIPLLAASNRGCALKVASEVGKARLCQVLPIPGYDSFLVASNMTSASRATMESVKKYGWRHCWVSMLNSTQFHLKHSHGLRCGGQKSTNRSHCILSFFEIRKSPHQIFKLSGKIPRQVLFCIYFGGKSNKHWKSYKH